MRAGVWSLTLLGTRSTTDLVVALLVWAGLGIDLVGAGGGRGGLRRGGGCLSALVGRLSLLALAAVRLLDLAERVGVLLVTGALGERGAGQREHGSGNQQGHQAAHAGEG